MRHDPALLESRLSSPVRRDQMPWDRIFMLAVAVVFGSWCGVVAVPLLVAGMAPRAVGEERMLRRKLSGYDEYARRVRFRLIPGIW